MAHYKATESEPLTPEAKQSLKVIFITLFLDLVGFSIIFPLFPAMLTYYIGKEGDTGLLGMVVRSIEAFSAVAGGTEAMGTVVLFGGVLGSLYALLQFVFAPILGSLSDRYGRKTILVWSIAGMAVSYLIWIVAGAFSVLVVSRTIGGIMSANISTASAVVADVTTPRNRSKGMALIGMAFGLGFIVGPAIGGFSAMVDLTERWPGLAAYGVNPFTVPAIVAFGLSAINLFFVTRRFKETLVVRPEDADRPRRTLNPIALFSAESYPGVTRVNLTNFVFLTAFSGMEFSLTFLALERFDFGPRENAYIFLFVGFVLAGMQGTYVRRRSDVIGPIRMATHGLICVIPGLAIIGLAQHVAVMFAGLALLAAGSAQVIPCLTALSSLYAPSSEQGRILGVFRSLGALARGVGPLIACILYWRLGSAASYFLGAAAIVVPLGMVATLPQPK